jgi:hypothetical protein
MFPVRENLGFVCMVRIGLNRKKDEVFRSLFLGGFDIVVVIGFVNIFELRK